MLSRSEEAMYARRASEGDDEAKERLVKANLRFVVSVAKRYRNLGLPLSDLINEGNIGLIRTVGKFDASRGYHFISYAVWWIKQSILKAASEQSRIIRLPLNRANDLVHIEKLRRQIPITVKDGVRIGEVAKKLRMDTEEVKKLISISQAPIPLEEPVFEQDDSTSFGDFRSPRSPLHP